MDSRALRQKTIFNIMRKHDGDTTTPSYTTVPTITAHSPRKSMPLFHTGRVKALRTEMQQRNVSELFPHLKLKRRSPRHFKSKAQNAMLQHYCRRCSYHFHVSFYSFTAVSAVSLPPPLISENGRTIYAKRLNWGAITIEQEEIFSLIYCPGRFDDWCFSRRLKIYGY